MYPLRLILSSLFSAISDGWFPSAFEINDKNEIIGLFAIYGFGLFAMAGILALLYCRAFLKRELLNLNSIEIRKTKNKISVLAAVSFTGFLAAILALVLNDNSALWSVLVYATIPVSVIFIKICSCISTLKSHFVIFRLKHKFVAVLLKH